MYNIYLDRVLLLFGIERKRERELQSGRISNYVIPTGDIFSIETLTTEREETLCATFHFSSSSSNFKVILTSSRDEYR